MLLNGYTTTDAAHLSGFTVRQLDYWSRQRFLVPGIQQSKGSGTRRIYSFDDLVQLRFIRRLKDLGWSTQKTRFAVKRLRQLMEQSDFEKPVIVTGKHMLLAICKTKDNERILIDALNPSGQQVMWIILDNLVEETKGAIARTLRIPRLEIPEVSSITNTSATKLASHRLGEAV